jgi:Flp pilus assembly protein TadG
MVRSEAQIMNSRHDAFESEQGAVLVYVAVAILALMAFSMFVVDYGVLWASRRQAQNVADSAALAGAVSLAFDDPTDISTSGPAALAARAVANAGIVWGQVPIADILIGDEAAGACPVGQAGICVRVDVYRNQSHGNPLPTFFGTFVGKNDQGIRATATAIAAVATGTDCLKPWGVVDAWAEHWPQPVVPWSQTSTFDKYMKSGNTIVPDPSITDPDVYVPPTTTTLGTGLHPFDSPGVYSSQYGMQFNLTVGTQQDFQFAAGWFAALGLLDSRGGNDYNTNIKKCLGITYKIGDQVPISTEPGEKVGPTRQGVETDADSLIGQDPGAYWDPAANQGHGGVAGSAFPVSPRVVAVPLVNPDEMVAANNNGRTSVTISNIMGFFVERYDSSQKAVVGRLVTVPGLLIATGGPVSYGSGFLKAVTLIR